MPKVDPKTIVNPIRARLVNDVSNKERLTKTISESKSLERNKDIANKTSAPVVQRARLSKAKKVLFTADEQEANDNFVNNIAKATGADTLGWSHISRAVWSLLRRAEEQMPNNKPPQLSRPSNGDLIGLAHFEDNLASYLLTLLKDTPK